MTPDTLATLRAAAAWINAQIEAGGIAGPDARFEGRHFACDLLRIAGDADGQDRIIEAMVADCGQDLAAAVRRDEWAGPARAQIVPWPGRGVVIPLRRGVTPTRPGDAA